MVVWVCLGKCCGHLYCRWLAHCHVMPHPCFALLALALRGGLRAGVATTPPVSQAKTLFWGGEGGRQVFTKHDFCGHSKVFSSSPPNPSTQGHLGQSQLQPLTPSLVRPPSIEAALELKAPEGKVVGKSPCFEELDYSSDRSARVSARGSGFQESTGGKWHLSSLSHGHASHR